MKRATQFLLMFSLISSSLACENSHKQVLTYEEHLQEIAMESKSATVKIVGETSIWVVQENGDVLPSVMVGTGVVFTEDGYILTAGHTLVRGNAYMVYFPGDNSPYLATRVAVIVEKDIGVLKILNPPHGLRELEFGNTPIPTQTVITVGHPQQQPWNVSVGRVENIYLETEGLTIQANVTSAPGASGSGLFSLDGKLIGVLQRGYIDNPSGFANVTLFLATCHFVPAAGPYASILTIVEFDRTRRS